MNNWIATREPRTWITVAEIVALAIVLLAGGALLRPLLGLPLLVHLGWDALTSVPVGEIPGPPEGVGERRRNYHLRYRVVAFLNEVQRVEQFVQDAKQANLPREEVEKNLRSAQKRIMATAGEVAEVLGKNGG